MSANERQLRSRVTQALSHGALIRATLTVRERVCGKANCKCTRGEKHVSLYAVSRQDGEVRQVCVPKHLEASVREWVEEYQRIQELLEQVSEIYWKKLQGRED
jgi:hypothetical protein